MLNSIESYSEAGRKAAIAQSRRDASLARFHSDWARKAMAYETPECRCLADNAYRAAYRAESGFVPFK